jgi:thiosulfate dehydrogenase [quinone] large subunit
MRSRHSPDDGIRHADRWLAVLRVVVGLWFLKGVITKLGIVMIADVVPIPAASPRWISTMPVLLARYAERNEFPFFKDFIETTVLTHPVLFANLTAFGETAVGIGLTFGVATVLAATIGLILSVLYGMSTQHMSPGQQGFHIVLIACMLSFIFARAGRRWGVDAVLRGRWRWWRLFS